MAKLPNPAMVGDFYLAAILEELKGLRADMARAPEPEPEAVREFREPEKPKSKRQRKKE